MDKAREQFEAWFSENKPKYTGEAYREVKASHWKAWKASRAALVVELPKGNYHSATEYEDELVIVLDKAGIKYE